MELFSDGILFLLAIQLLLVSFLHLYERSGNKAIFLGFISLILALWYFHYIFHSYWKENYLLLIIIGPDKTVFIPPLLLFYFKSIYSPIDKGYLFKHLLYPSLIFLTSLSIRYSYPNLWSSIDSTEAVLFLVFGVSVFWFYFFVTRNLIKGELREHLLPKAYKRVQLLFYSFYLFLLILPIFDLFKSLVNTGYFSYDLKLLNPQLYLIFFEYLEAFLYGYFFLTTFIFLLYSMTELSILRRFLFPNNALVSKNLHQNSHAISEIIDSELLGKKLYKDQSINADSFARKYGLSKNDVLDYLKLMNKGSFIDMVNLMRINEFKALLKKDEYKHYNLHGLATEVGFNSKSTFFRVFKKIEGMTPNQYKKSF